MITTIGALLMVVFGLLFVKKYLTVIEIENLCKYGKITNHETSTIIELDFAYLLLQSVSNKLSKEEIEEFQVISKVGKEEIINAANFLVNLKIIKISKQKEFKANDFFIPYYAKIMKKSLKQHREWRIIYD